MNFCSCHAWKTLVLNGVVVAGYCLYRGSVSLMTHVTIYFKALAMGVAVLSSLQVLVSLTTHFLFCVSMGGA